MASDDKVTEILSKFTSDALAEIKEVNKTVNNVVKTSAEVKVIVGDLLKNSDRHNKFIFGNGEEGAKTSISSLRQEDETIRTKIDEQKKYFNNEIKSLRGLVKVLIMAFWALVLTIIGALLSL